MPPPVARVDAEPRDVRRIVRRALNNYAVSLLWQHRFEEAKTLLRKSVPAARRVFGESDQITLTMRKVHADVLCYDPVATLDEFREAVAMYEDTARIARRVLGSTHPSVQTIERSLESSRATLRAREMVSSCWGI